jgi:polar amino acid transport system permease protein
VSSAYTAEIFRAGIEAIPHGQFEASQALGLSYRHMMVDVILPQAIKIVIPPLTNNCINVMKDTALASVVAMPDLLKQATQAQALVSQSLAADRRSPHLCRPALAVGQHRRAP